MLSEYDSLRTGAASFDFASRTRMEITGSDRTTVLHNFCTNDIKSLRPGRNCEAFICDVKGKVLGHVAALCRGDSLLLETSPDQTETLIGHLDRYIIMEQVEFADRRSVWRETFLVGPSAAEVVSSLIADAPPEPDHHVEVETSWGWVLIAATPFGLPDTFMLLYNAANDTDAQSRLAAAGARPCDESVWDIFRIESGLPMFGRDIDNGNLPQEVDRDDRTISFQKGCYLGQETVARIDALGHVNRKLCGVRYPKGETLPDGCEIQAEAGLAGILKSSVYSPAADAMVGLAYLKSAYNPPGTELSCAGQQLTTVKLPL